MAILVGINPAGRGRRPACADRPAGPSRREDRTTHLRTGGPGPAAAGGGGGGGGVAPGRRLRRNTLCLHASAGDITDNGPGPAGGGGGGGGKRDCAGSAGDEAAIMRAAAAAFLSAGGGGGDGGGGAGGGGGRRGIRRVSSSFRLGDHRADGDPVSD